MRMKKVMFLVLSLIMALSIVVPVYANEWITDEADYRICSGGNCTQDDVSIMSSAEESCNHSSVGAMTFSWVVCEAHSCFGSGHQFCSPVFQVRGYVCVRCHQQVITSKIQLW
jgi:hypothetical protein